MGRFSLSVGTVLLSFFLGIATLKSAEPDQNRTSNSEQAPDCSRKAGSVLDEKIPAGTLNEKIPIEHIIILMQENHSFDSYFGRLNAHGYENQVDGLNEDMHNPDDQDKPVFVHHSKTLCPADPHHRWDDEHASWDDGRLDGFVKRNGPDIMAYFDETDLPFYYSLANEYAIADRYFSSTLSQTHPNRFFLYAGTAFGHVKNEFPWETVDHQTIFDLMSSHQIKWKYYTDRWNYLEKFSKTYRRNRGKVGDSGDFQTDLKNNELPQVVFLESKYDEHPPQDIQKGQEWVADQLNALMSSTSWATSAVFFTYDENGGFYDHVAPPPACKPDDIKPNSKEISIPGDYDRYGFRVPFILVSPYAKHHYVSHRTYDHTSILKFIETKFNLPALSNRDANADSMLDLFDFQNPPHAEIPKLASADLDAKKWCWRIQQLWN